jgi:hypothetical protein
MKQKIAELKGITKNTQKVLIDNGYITMGDVCDAINSNQFVRKDKSLKWLTPTQYKNIKWLGEYYIEKALRTKQSENLDKNFGDNCEKEVLFNSVVPSPIKKAVVGELLHKLVVGNKSFMVVSDYKYTGSSEDQALLSMGLFFDDRLKAMIYGNVFANKC